jgi:hypothetical protein
VAACGEVGGNRMIARNDGEQVRLGPHDN